MPESDAKQPIQGDYVIPAGTRILGNHWAIHRDATVFTNPEKFDPTRWLVREEGKPARLDNSLKHVQFG
ncbi:hypothetical protein EMMF5_006602, partial [Cystobasidiomycetes sp. EMM_F5]